MNYLLDTHACIWSIAEKNKLPPKIKRILSNPSNHFWVSQISLFEIAIKLKIGKLTEFKTSFAEFINAIYLSGYEMLPIKDEHFELYSAFEFNQSHRDPFDRYLIATAQFENLEIITKDEKYKFYSDKINIVW